MRPALLPTAAAIGLLAVYFFVRFRDALLVFFARDDFWAMDNAAAIHFNRLADIGQVFRFSHNGFLLYRPLTAVGYFYVLRQLFGYDASAYHALHLAVHGLNGLLVFAIARRLTASTIGGLAAAVVYAAEPGHASAVYWLSTFTMSGTALVVLTMIYLWLRTSSSVRAVGCATLQVVGLLASEHAVVAPLLLVTIALLRSEREPRRRVVAHLAVPSIVVTAYLTAKVYYFSAVRPFVVTDAYAPRLDLVGWLQRLGQYSAASLNALALLPLGRRALIGLGCAVTFVVVAALWRVGRGSDRWRLIAIGGSLFVISLLPVLPLAGHYFSYFIGIAGLGAALAAVGSCQLVGGVWWRGVAVSIVALIVLIDVATDGRAVRDNPEVVLVKGTAEWSARWVYRVRNVGDAEQGVREVLIPRDGITDDVFALGGAQRFFTADPPRVEVYSPTQPPTQAPGRVVLVGQPPPIPDAQLPGWEPQWHWLRLWAGMPG